MLENNAEFITEFEKRLAEYTGAEEAVVVDSCSNALFLSMMMVKKLYKELTKEQEIPNGTYVSVPQAMIRAGYKPVIKDKVWGGFYQIGDLPLIDSATYLSRGMCDGTVKHTMVKFVCTSFHEKKILKIGRGGAILTNSKKTADILRRMAFDGRDYRKGMLDDDITMMGYHMNMPPADAAKGLLLLNQLPDENEPIGDWTCYKPLNELKYFEKYYKED
jgi:dTDP-4-amino-4,6-dideoxygalactose transaminase